MVIRTKGQLTVIPLLLVESVKDPGRELTSVEAESPCLLELKVN